MDEEAVGFVGSAMRMSAHIRKVAVVGGGPSGATCAGRLARAGLEVMLFEASPSREKPCGGGIPGAALEEFPELLDFAEISAADVPGTPSFQ